MEKKEGKEVGKEAAISILLPTDLYTVERAADLLDCSPRVLSDKIRNGEIKAYKKLGRWFIFADDIHTWIKGGDQVRKKKPLNK